MQKVFGVKLFRAGYFERRIYLKSIQLKQNQSKVNSAKFVKNIYPTNSIWMSWSSGFVLKAYHIENLDSKIVQNLITIGKNRCFGNIFWLNNFRVFETIKLVTFCKSWGHILVLQTKAKSSLIFPATKNLKKNLKTLWSLAWLDLFISRLQSHYKETVFFVSLSPRSSLYSFDWPRKDESMGQLGITQCF